jgi:hypothetical protein
MSLSFSVIHTHARARQRFNGEVWQEVFSKPNLAGKILQAIIFEKQSTIFLAF